MAKFYVESSKPSDIILTPAKMLAALTEFSKHYVYNCVM
jgi:hypothetical protein